MVASYVHHIAAWMDGTESLSDGEYRVYHVVCQMIYQTNGPIVLHESGIAGRCKQHVLAFRRNLAKLVERQKLMVGPDGKLSNRRAETELKSRINPPANSTQTPARPPPDSPQTTAQHPPNDAAKPLISGASTGTEQLSRGSVLLTSSKSQSIQEGRKNQKKRKSTTELIEVLPGIKDDWPDDYEDQFWDKYPKGRKHDQVAVYGLLFKLRREGFIDAKKKRQRLSWAVLMTGLDLYIASDPGEYAKAPLPWLRGQRWTVTDYPNRGTQNGKGNYGTGKVDAFAAAAARRFGGGTGNGAASGPTDSVSSTNGMGHERPGTRGGGDTAVELDLKPGPDGVFRE